MRRYKSQEQARPSYTPREPLGKRIARFLMLMGALFVITITVVVTQRLSRDSLALLIGLSCGIAAMLPTIGLGILVWRRDEARARAREAQQQIASQPYVSPPVIVVSPESMHGNSYGSHALPPGSQPWPWATTPQSGRNFTIVGGEE